MEHFDVAVIGAGAAGTMAFLRCVLNGDRAVLFSGNPQSKRKGRANWVVEVDNIPGMHDLKRPITATSRTTLRWIAEHEDLKRLAHHEKALVTSVKKVDGGFELGYAAKKETASITASFVINATGVMDVQPEINGSIQPILPFANRGCIIYCIRCDGHRTIGKRLSVIGNRDSAIDIAAMLQERYGHERVSILTNALVEKFSESALELAAAYGMEIFREPIVDVRGDAKKAKLEGFALASGRVVESNCTIVSLGIIPYNQLVLQAGADVDENGRVLVNKVFETSIPDLFVVGDLVSGRKMQVYTAWDEAVDAADEINRRKRMKEREKRL